MNRILVVSTWKNSWCALAPPLGRHVGDGALEDRDLLICFTEPGPGFRIFRVCPGRFLKRRLGGLPLMNQSQPAPDDDKLS